MLAGCHVRCLMFAYVMQEGPIVVFIADLNRSRSAEKECHLSLLEQTKIDRAKNDQSFTTAGFT